MFEFITFYSLDIKRSTAGVAALQGGRVDAKSGNLDAVIFLRVFTCGDQIDERTNK